MIRTLRAWLARWIHPGTPGPPTAAVVALVTRVESGHLTTRERFQLAELVMCVAAAVHGAAVIKDHPADPADPGHVLAAWEPVGWQLKDLLRAARAEQ